MFPEYGWLYVTNYASHSTHIKMYTVFQPISAVNFLACTKFAEYGYLSPAYNTPYKKYIVQRTERSFITGHNHIRLNVRVMTTAETGKMREVVSYSKVRVTAEPSRPIAELGLCGTE